MTPRYEDNSDLLVTRRRSNAQLARYGRKERKVAAIHVWNAPIIACLRIYPARCAVDIDLRNMRLVLLLGIIPRTLC